jgi:hypothetical protein
VAYQVALRKVVAANSDELRGDLDHARHLLQRARLQVSELERQVASLESLLMLADDVDASNPEPSGLTLHEAMSAVLKSAPAGMLRAGDLAAEINRQQLYRMRDGRPVEAQQIHARVGHYQHLFAKEGTFIKLHSDLRPSRGKTV